MEAEDDSDDSMDDIAESPKIKTSIIDHKFIKDLNKM